MKNVRALLFDIDGTLLDTSEFIFQATEYAMKVCGYPVPSRNDIASTAGISFPGFYIKLAGENADVGKLMETHWAFQYENFHLAKVYPNTAETLKKLKEKGYRLAAVTARSKKTSHQTLKDAGIFQFFDTVVSLEDAKEPKPNPAPLLKALDILNETPVKAAMVGDSHLDIEAGKNAGMKTVRATYGFHKEKMHDPEPDYFIDDIRDFLEIL